MNLSTRYAFIGFWLLFAAKSLSAQVGFTLPEISQVQPGADIELPVTVEGFTDIAGVQFVIQWDPTVLYFDTVVASNLPALSIESFGRTQTNLGILRFVWTSQSGSGVTRPDGFTLFTLRFQVIGGLYSNTGVTITELPPATFFEGVTASGQSFDLDEVTLTQGAVCVNCNVSTREITSDFDFEIAPNPVDANTQVRFTLREASATQLVVTDPAGRVIAGQDLELSAGPQAVDLPTVHSYTPGLYYLTVRTAKNSVRVRPFLID